MNVVAYVPDLMDRSKVAAAAEGARFVPDPAGLPDAAAGADLVVVDLDRPGVLDVLARIDAPVVGFASHVRGDVLEAARRAGCRDALPRSRFFATLTTLLADPAT